MLKNLTIQNKYNISSQSKEKTGISAGFLISDEIILIRKERFQCRFQIKSARQIYPEWARLLDQGSHVFRNDNPRQSCPKDKD